MSRGPNRKFDWNEAQRLRDEGWTYQRIGDHFGVSDSAVWLALNPDARERQRQRLATWQMSGVCEDCGGHCIHPKHRSRTEHRARDGRALCIKCRGRASRTGVTVTSGAIHVRCGSCKTEKQLNEFSARVARLIISDQAVRKRTCRACETRKRQAYRERHKIPCKQCGAPCLPANEKGARQKDSRLCKRCWGRHADNPINQRAKRLSDQVAA